MSLCVEKDSVLKRRAIAKERRGLIDGKQVLINRIYTVEGLVLSI
ncbi:hypothetical protein [Nostoc linckia]|nr:hypothetical protein [Nostoc linckia]